MSNSTEVDITNRFWAAFAPVFAHIYPDHHGLRGGGETMNGRQAELPRTGLHQLMYSVAGLIIDRERIPMSIDDEIVFAADGRVTIQERDFRI